MKKIEQVHFSVLCFASDCLFGFYDLQENHEVGLSYDYKFAYNMLALPSPKGSGSFFWWGRVENVFTWCLSSQRLEKMEKPYAWSTD